MSTLFHAYAKDRDSRTSLPDNLAVMQKINKNMYKPPVSEAVKNILRKNFTREIEFYEFCKQRLHMQYVALTQLEGGPLLTSDQ